MQVVPDGHRCECGNRGCWEQYASGNALVREARELVGARLAGGPASCASWSTATPTRSTGPLVTEAARDGDPAAIELLRRGRPAGSGVGLAGLAAAFDPGLLHHRRRRLRRGRAAARPGPRGVRAGRSPAAGTAPSRAIVRAELGTDAGFIGAADLAWQDLAHGAGAGHDLQHLHGRS